MLYQRSLDIERRLQSILTLIETGEYSTPALANEVGVSIPTISRDVTALRQRGHDIHAERQNGAWRYVLAVAKTRKRRSHDATDSRRKPR
jgi:predicted DNA-binding transcriptional regulator YafY